MHGRDDGRSLRRMELRFDLVLNKTCAIAGNRSKGNLTPTKAPRLCSEETHCQSSTWPTEPPCAPFEAFFLPFIRRCSVESRAAAPRRCTMTGSQRRADDPKTAGDLSISNHRRTKICDTPRVHKNDPQSPIVTMFYCPGTFICRMHPV